MRIQLPDDTSTVRLYSEEEMGDDYEPPGPEVQTDHERGMKYVRVKKRVGEKMMEGRGRGRFKDAVEETQGGGDTPASDAPAGDEAPADEQSTSDGASTDEASATDETAESAADTADTEN